MESSATGSGAGQRFFATINWGDGSTSTGIITYVSSSGSYKVKGSHTYATKDAHTVTTTVAEAGSGGTMKMALAAVKKNHAVSSDDEPADQQQHGEEFDDRGRG